MNVQWFIYENQQEIEVLASGTCATSHISIYENDQPNDTEPVKKRKLQTPLL